MKWKFFSAMLLSVNFVFSQDGPIVDKIIAKVDNYIILKSDLELAFQTAMSQGEKYSADLKCEILQSLIINKLMVAKAEIDSVIVDEDEVNQELDYRINYMLSQIGSVEKLESYYGKSMDQIKEEIFDDMKEQKVIQKMQATITENVEISPSEVKRFFKSIPADSLPFFSKEVEVAQIVKTPKVGKVEKQKAYDQLMTLRKQIVEGADFSYLASKYSMEPSAAVTGGDLGFADRGDMVPEFEAAALALEINELSLPIESPFGLHLIQLLEKRGTLYHARHILIIPKPSADDFLITYTELDSLRELILKDSITFEKAAKEHSEDKSTSAHGGYLKDASGASRISVEALDPVMFFTIDTMQLNTLSKPIRFAKQDGDDALRLVFFKSKMSPHQANLNDDYQKISDAALANKKNKKLTEWFAEAQYEVFIEVDPEYENCNLLKTATN